MKDKFKLIRRIIYVAVIILLLVVIGFILYCKVQDRIYYKKGPNYEPDYSVYIISSHSMKPEYNKYDLIINKKVDVEDIEVGDVITFKSTSIESFGMIITHRVTSYTVDEKNRTAFMTKGDANESEDSAYARGDNVIGKVVFKVPFIGFLGTWMGMFFLVIIVFASIFLKKVFKGVNLRVQ